MNTFATTTNSIQRKIIFPAFCLLSARIYHFFKHRINKSIKKSKYLKPVRLKRSTDPNSSHDFELVGGRIRYWAWVIAHGKNCPEIPAYIRENYTN